jgi:hypothetical protein
MMIFKWILKKWDGRVQLKCDGTRWRTGGEVKGKLANWVSSQYSSHYLGTWCIQHYYRWCAHLGCQQSTELTPSPIWMDSSVSPKDQIWFLRLYHHISNSVYGVEGMNLAHDRDKWRAILNEGVNFRVPQNSGKFWASCGIIEFSRRTLLHAVDTDLMSKYKQSTLWQLVTPHVCVFRISCTPDKNSLLLGRLGLLVCRFEARKLFLHQDIQTGSRAQTDLQLNRPMYRGLFQRT